jgi:hypothetical protein
MAPRSTVSVILRWRRTKPPIQGRATWPMAKGSRICAAILTTAAPLIAPPP